MVESLDEKAKPKTELPVFQPSLHPRSEQNIEAAEARGLGYDSRRRVYVDEDGAPQLDRFGQPLG